MTKKEQECEYRTVSFLVSALANMCAASPNMIIDRLTYTLKMILGWICFHLWMATSGQLYDNGPRWLYDWLLSWGGFYAYSMGYEHYREMRG